MPPKALVPIRHAAGRLWARVEHSPMSAAAVYACMMLCFLALVARPSAGILSYPPLFVGGLGAAYFLQEVMARPLPAPTQD